MDINKFENLGKTKCMWFYYYLMCPKTREKLLNEYKSKNTPIPEYLDETKLINNNVNKDNISKLTKNINKKYINQKYLQLLNSIEHFNYNINYINYIILIILFIMFLFILYKLKLF
jgi:hypothetical protein